MQYELSETSSIHEFWRYQKLPFHFGMRQLLHSKLGKEEKPLRKLKMAECLNRRFSRANTEYRLLHF